MSSKEVEKITIPKERRWHAEKPRFNGFAIGHGVHGDVSYNRNREKRKFKKEVDAER